MFWIFIVLITTLSIVYVLWEIGSRGVQGKHLVSVQVQVAVNYILPIQQKIEDLSIERDKMKAIANSKRISNVSLDGVQFSCNIKIL